MKGVSHSGRNTYPLSILFVLVAACAVMAALVTPVARSVVEGQVGLAEAAGASVSSTLATMLLGGTIGLYHYRRVRGFCWGILTGAAVGIFVGPLILAPISAFPALITLSGVGAAILLMIGISFRLAQRR